MHRVTGHQKFLKLILLNFILGSKTVIAQILMIQQHFFVISGKKKVNHIFFCCVAFQINWKMLLGGLFPQEPQPHEVLIVHNPNYLRKLGRIIALFGKR